MDGGVRIDEREAPALGAGSITIEEQGQPEVKMANGSNGFSW